MHWRATSRPARRLLLATALLLSVTGCQTATSGIEEFVRDEFPPVCPSRNDTPETINALADRITKWEHFTGEKVQC